LLALAEEERHGYGIMQDVARQTDGGLELGPGTLYGCLKRMLAAGLVEESDERRRYYRMTTLGKRTVRTEAQRLAGAVMVAMARLVRRLAPHHGPGESLRPLVRRPQTRQA
jgi:DNA-binding PadR family transcriptional regulator